MARGGSGPRDGMPPTVRPLTVGDPVIIGRYLLLGRLGSGGMGVVYLAERLGGGLVAVKTPHLAHLGDATLRARFAEEIALSARVVPLCIAAVLESGVDQGRPYLVTEYIPGPALSQVVAAHGALTPDLAYGVALGVAAALTAVHEAGLVHRDLKPGNVLLSPDGPRLIDFGIAMDVDTHSVLTQAGQVMGSPGWVAPERCMGGPAVPASDVFAWGCLVAYAATGHHPFGSGEPDVVTRRILVEPPRLTGLPALLLPTVKAALAKDPADRPTAAELLLALLAAGGIGAPSDPRAAVARVLEEIWTPVPYPKQPPVRPAAPRRPRERRRPAYLGHASFAALATVSIAAVTVAAAIEGWDRPTWPDAGGRPDPYAAPPASWDGEGGTARSTARVRQDRVAGTSSAVRPPTTRRPPTVVVVTTTHAVPIRFIQPDDGGGQAVTEPPIASDPDVPPRPVRTRGPECAGIRGIPRLCLPRPRPIPSGGIGVEPQWGDEESPSPTPAPTVSASASDSDSVSASP